MKIEKDRFIGQFPSVFDFYNGYGNNVIPQRQKQIKSRISLNLKEGDEVDAAMQTSKFQYL